MFRCAIIGVRKEVNGVCGLLSAMYESLEDAESFKVNEVLRACKDFEDAFDKLREIVKETIKSFQELVQEFFDNWLVEECSNEANESIKELLELYEKCMEELEMEEKFFPSDHLAYTVLHTQIFDNRPLIFWSGFV